VINSNLDPVLHSLATIHPLHTDAQIIITLNIFW